MRGMHDEFTGTPIECPVPQSQEFWRALKTLGVPTSLMIYPGEGHEIEEPAHWHDLENRMIARFDRYLK